MKKQLLRTLAVTMTILMLLGSTAIAEDSGSRGIAYRVTGGKNEMIILGSIHIGNEEMYPMSDELTSAIADADTLVFECDTDAPETIMLMLEMMILPKGETLQDHLSEETYQLTEKAVIETLGIPITAFSMYQPWAVFSTLSVSLTSMEMGVDDITQAMALGVESQIKEMTKDDGKEIAYLETAELQLGMMNDFSPELQDYLLKVAAMELLSDPDEVSTKSDLKLWPSWWHDGDAERFFISCQSPHSEDQDVELMHEYNDAMLTQRNIGMAEGIRELLESDEEHSYFVTVELLRLVLPDDSVITHLREKGYTVEKID